MSFRDFSDFKSLQTQVGNNFEITESGERIRISEIKITRFESRESYYVSTSYEDPLEKVFFNKKKCYKPLTLKPAYKKGSGVPEKKERHQGPDKAGSNPSGLCPYVASAF